MFSIQHFLTASCVPLSRDVKDIYQKTDDLDQEKDYATICEEAGNPKDTAMAYLENCDEDYLIKKAFKRSLLKKLLLLILVIIIVFIIYACYMLIEYNRLAETQQIITEEVTIIEED